MINDISIILFVELHKVYIFDLRHHAKCIWKGIFSCNTAPHFLLPLLCGLESLSLNQDSYQGASAPSFLLHYHCQKAKMDGLISPPWPRNWLLSVVNFSIFSVANFIFHRHVHSCTLSKTLSSSLFFCSLRLIIDSWEQRCVIRKELSHLTFSTSSLMYTRKTSGSRTDPWGTPADSPAFRIFTIQEDLLSTIWEVVLDKFEKIPRYIVTLKFIQ